VIIVSIARGFDALEEKLAFIGADRLFVVLPEIQSKKKAGVVRNPGFLFARFFVLA